MDIALFLKLELDKCASQTCFTETELAKKVKLVMVYAVVTADFTCFWHCLNSLVSPVKLCSQVAGEFHAQMDWTILQHKHKKWSFHVHHVWSWTWPVCMRVCVAGQGWVHRVPKSLRVCVFCWERNSKFYSTFPTCSSCNVWFREFTRLCISCR